MGAVSSEWACLWANRPQTFSANEECSEESRSGVLRVGRKWGLVCAQWAPWWLRAGRGWTVETSTLAGRGAPGSRRQSPEAAPRRGRAHRGCVHAALHSGHRLVDTAHGGHGSWWTRLVATGWACGVHRSGLWGIGTSPPLWGQVGRVPSGPTGGLARPGQPPCSAGGRSPSCSLCVGISQGPEEPRAEPVQPPTPATCRDAHEAGPAPTRPSWLSLPRAPATSPS